MSPIQGIIQSFYDAPDGFKEELQKISISTGFSYNYDSIFECRTGFFYENPTKGNRRYITLGVGTKVKMMKVNISYLFSVSKIPNPMEKSLKLSLNF
ncbi:PorV/PorQ family protein [Capnocytophaga catalasegens]|uniref:Uncharacterized protein n=1 Tax=Capnocytophaga catalasegens TaxID=1004260 RepID=A0AAV5AY97_9FLAO|nr:PorV/PorQ family protein [Capnocytophaga catalasegens]GIZ15995.1 hypothetical protein RCZ03_19950 [Capnocytophaga catalasegens]GJM50410.1 hypothetical protein RCZ15_13830 [Capnocytophaga catalasegens]GJM51798.1 hypothetical protein RCZ16_01160 [Capnocytophaga catalasegens]